MGIEGKPAAVVLAPEAPYPLAGGGALRTASLVHYLAQRYTVDLVIFGEAGAPDAAAALPAGLVERVTAIDLPAHGRYLAARVARNAGRLARRVPPLVDRFGGFERAVAQALAGRHYELGVIEHFWCAPYLEVLAPHCERTVLNLHNIESLLHARCAAVESAGPALAHRVFGGASERLESAWLPRFSEVLVASEADRREAARLAPSARLRVYPNSIPLRPVPVQTKEHVIVFSGNLEYHPNISAVRFFARAVWPTLRDRWPRLVWRLVGKNPAAVGRLVAGDRRVEFTGAVEDALPELARAEVAVVPVVAGSGTRLKILEAWAAALPVVSTTLGAEGLPVCDGKNIRLADSPRAFAESVSWLLGCTEERLALGEAGRSLLEKEFHWEASWRYLDF
ncbi:MAG: glycosyltransferase [Bryobacteraceae bacterium]